MPVSAISCPTAATSSSFFCTVLATAHLLKTEEPPMTGGLMLSHAADDLFAIPHATRDIQSDNVQEDECDSEREQRPPLADLRREESHAREHHGGEGDDEPGDLLRGAARLHARGHDHRDAAGRDE